MSAPVVLGIPSESDLDLLLLEEAYASPGFLTLLASRVSQSRLEVGPVERVQHSAVRYNGESDLELTWDLPDGRRARLLVENKVNAEFQPDQAERYRVRAEKYLRDRDCAVAATLLIAPSAYLKRTGQEHGFDGCVSYEDIATWFEQQAPLGRRQQFKLALLRAAIDKPQRSMESPRDPRATEFWHSYWQTCDEQFPEVGMRKPEDAGVGSSWITFSPSGVSMGVRLRHKLTHGQIDLELADMGRRWAEVRTRFRRTLPSGAEVVQAGRAAAIRLSVPPLDYMLSFADQENEALEGMRAAETLLTWYTRHRDAVEQLRLTAG